MDCFQHSINCDFVYNCLIRIPCRGRTQILHYIRNSLHICNWLKFIPEYELHGSHVFVHMSVWVTCDSSHVCLGHMYLFTCLSGSHVFVHMSVWVTCTCSHVCLGHWIKCIWSLSLEPGTHDCICSLYAEIYCKILSYNERPLYFSISQQNHTVPTASIPPAVASLLQYGELCMCPGLPATCI